MGILTMPAFVENSVARLGTLTYSTKGDPQWRLVRCVQRPTGEYVGTAEQYTGGRALNQVPTPPTGVVDGPAVRLVFNTAATATLRIGTQSIPIQRYQFSDQWASPMSNAPRAGWWDQRTPSGRGYFLEVQGNTLLISASVYSSSGQPTWLTATGPVSAGGVFSSALTACSTATASDAAAQAPTCASTANKISLVFSSPWRATLTLGQEPPIEIRRHRQNEIGWAGPDSVASPQAERVSPRGTCGEGCATTRDKHAFNLQRANAPGTGPCIW